MNENKGFKGGKLQKRCRRWFSPEEKLPELGERVIVATQTMLLMTAEFKASPKKAMEYLFTTYEGSFTPDEIVMWTRLPKMYKKDNGDTVTVQINLPKREE